MEYVLSFRFESEPSPVAVDAIRGAVQMVCAIHGIQRPLETVGDPPTTLPVPTVEQIADLITVTEGCNANEN